MKNRRNILTTILILERLLNSLTTLAFSPVIVAVRQKSIFSQSHLKSSSSTTTPFLENESQNESIIQRTQYTIDDSVCPPTDRAELKKIVVKHCASLPRFLGKKPIARHTQEAYDQVMKEIDLITSGKDNMETDIILDSGCGTGRSSILLGEQYPNHIVIGIDRSFVRLSRRYIMMSDEQERDNIENKEGEGEKEENEIINPESDEIMESAIHQSNHRHHHSEEKESMRPICQKISTNVILVRAELTDFWRLCLKEDKNFGHKITHHFILYPNPYPKKNRIKKRFYAHPSLPIICQIGGEVMVRSNWRGYLEEFEYSVQCAQEYYNNDCDSEEEGSRSFEIISDGGVKERIDKSVALTNFERKYDNVGEKTYELRMTINQNT